MSRLRISAHPAAALQSATAVSTIPVLRSHAGRIALTLLLPRERNATSTADRLRPVSISRNGRASEFVVQAQRYHGVGAVHVIGELTVWRSGAPSRLNALKL